MPNKGIFIERLEARFNTLSALVYDGEGMGSKKDEIVKWNCRAVPLQLSASPELQVEGLEYSDV